MLEVTKEAVWQACEEARKVRGPGDKCQRENFILTSFKSHDREEHKTKMGDSDCGGADMAVELEAGLNADRDREISEIKFRNF